MRILHVVPSVAPDRGGPSRSVRQLVDVLRKRGLDVRLAAAGASDVDVPLAHLSCRGEIPDRASRRRLAEAIGQSQVVEIHSFWNGTVSIAAAMARRSGVPYVLTPRGMLDPACLASRGWTKALYRAAIDRRTIGGARGFHFLSEEERDRAALGTAGRRTPAVVAPNGAPEVGLAPAGPSLRTRWPGVGDRPVLLAFGRIDPIKGLDLAIRALARIAPAGRPALLLVGPDYGAGPSLRELARREGVEASVVWGEPVFGEERFRLLAEADLVVLVSRYDCNPVVATEAFAAGGAVLATEGCGLAACARAGAAAVVPRTPEAFAAEVARLLAHPACRADLRRGGRAYAADRLAWDRAVEPLVELYRRLAS